MKVGYSPKVKELFMQPKNAGVMEDADVTAIAGSVACGDMLKLYLKIDGEKGIIERATFESYGCVANIATSSMITEMIKGKTLEYARELTFKDEITALGGLPKIKYHCAALAVQALKIALKKWDFINGKRELDEEFAKSLLRGILDPTTDKDLITSGSIKRIDIDGKNVALLVHISSEEHRDEILSNINEVFEKMDVKLKIEED